MNEFEAQKQISAAYNEGKRDGEELVYEILKQVREIVNTYGSNEDRDMLTPALIEFLESLMND
jgi:urease gamma subunit